MRRFLALGLLFVLLVCSIPAMADGPVIAMVPKSYENKIFEDARVGAEGVADELGITVEWVASERADVQEQIAVLEALIERSPAGILVSCNEADAMVDVINKAVDAGIIVATFDSDSPVSKRAFFISTDDVALGEQAALELRALLPDGGRVAVLSSFENTPNLARRVASFAAGLEGSGIEIVATVYGEDEVQRSVEVVDEYMAGDDALDAWFFAGGWPLMAEESALAQVAAFRESGGVVVSIDSLPEMVVNLEKGMADVLIGQDYVSMGEQGMRQIVRMLKGEEPEADADGAIYTGFDVVMP